MPHSVCQRPARGPEWSNSLACARVQLCCRPDALKDVRGAERAKTGVHHPAVKGVTHEQIAANGCSIHIARAGVSASKPLILFLHGFPECAPAAGGRQRAWHESRLRPSTFDGHAAGAASPSSTG